MRRIRRMAVVVVLLALGTLVACDPMPGEARLKITDGKTLRASGPTATCTSPQEVIGEVLWPSFEWSGTVGGQAASLGLTGMLSPTIDFGIMRVGGSTYQVGAGEGSVQEVKLSATGTLEVKARLDSVGGQGSIGLTAVITCPTWGTADVTGQLDEHVAGPLPACPGASDPNGTWKLEGNETSGAWRALTFTSSGGTAIDGATYAAGSSTWSATNQPGEPPAVIARAVGPDGVLHAVATLAPGGGGATAPVQVSADLRCSIPPS